MRMIPPYPNPNTHSNAEKRLFQELQKINWPDTICFHSLDLPDHEYKGMGELDFVILSPQGLLVLEVKGGRISCKDGIWYYEDRWGEKHDSSEGPFQQARSGMFSLWERVNARSQASRLKDIVVGFGVVFPDVDFQVEGEEWDQRMVMDREKWTNGGVSGYIRELQKYWHAKYDHKPAAVSQAIVDEIAGYLRPNFDLVPSIEVLSEQIEARMVKLTEEQYSRLDIMEDSPRILIQGGAGTGKTFLAMEVARRHAQAGEKTLLVCFSPVLAEHLKHQKNGTDIMIRSVHGLMRTHVQRDPKALEGYYPGMPITDPWFTKKLAPAFELMTRDLPDSEKYDVLIVDEGQDILNLAYLGGIEHMLRGGFEKGKWRIFYDPYHQGGIYNSMDADTLKMLEGFGAAPARLKVNCRNTDPIVTQTKIITREQFATESTGHGPEVKMIFYNNRIEQAKKLEEFLEALLAQNISPGAITILSPGQLNKSGVSQISNRFKNSIQVVNGNIEDPFQQDRITFSSVAEFKGLENQYIALIDIENLDSKGDIDTLYVGMTRPRIQLWMGILKSQQTRWNEISAENLKKMAGS